MKPSLHAIVAAAVGLALVARVAVAQQADRWENGARRPDRVDIYRTIGDVGLTIDVYLPQGHAAMDRRAAVVFFFGGGWSNGSTRQFAHHAAYFASRGMVAFAADYRVHGRHQSTIADAVADAHAAVRWVRANARRLGVDPDRIASAGGSAGGHLAACVGILPPSADPNDANDANFSARSDAMLLFNPALSLLADDFSTDRADAGRAKFADRLGAEAEALSPLEHVRADLPPAILFHGELDTAVPIAQARKFVKRMHEAGNRAELAAYDGEAHGFFNYGRGDGQRFADTLRRADEFLASLGYVSGPDRVEAYVKSIDAQTGKK